MISVGLKLFLTLLSSSDGIDKSDSFPTQVNNNNNNNYNKTILSPKIIQSRKGIILPSTRHFEVWGTLAPSYVSSLTRASKTGWISLLLSICRLLSCIFAPVHESHNFYPAMKGVQLWLSPPFLQPLTVLLLNYLFSSNWSIEWF